MKMFAQGLLLGCLALGFASTTQAHSRKATRARVNVVCSCDDATGKLYAEALHNALGNSQHYREVSRSEGLDDNVIRISIVSLPLDEGAAGQAPHAALSIVCLHNGSIIHQFVETCTHLSIAECAQSMLTDLLEWEAGSPV